MQQNNNTANQIFANDKMIQQPQQTATRSRSKVGMRELANIVLNLQRDFKRVANALSVQGAQAIVDKHNDNSPHAPWSLLHQDVNKDGIPDIIIRNSNNEPIIVNGWTTKGSDYPERYQYYNAYPTKEERKQHPYPKYKRDELYQIKYDTDNHDAHKIGNVTSYNEQPFPEGWNTEKYNVNKNPGKRLSAYQRFQKLIANPVIENIIIPEFVKSHLITLNQQGKWPDKLKYVAQVSALLWHHFIIYELARRGHMQPDSKQFRKFKNSAEGKQVIDNTVTEFFYHFHQINNQLGWTEEKRNELQGKVIRFAADELFKLIRDVGAVPENQHVYPDYHEDAVEFNAEEEGEFGKAWGTD